MTHLTARATPTRTPAHHAPAATTLRPTGPARMREEPGVRFALLHVVLVGATLASGVLAGSETVRLAVLGLVALAATPLLAPGPALAVALSAWALWTGFVEHRFGQLTLAPTDLARLALLLLLAAAGAAACGVLRAGRRRG